MYDLGPNLSKSYRKELATASNKILCYWKQWPIYAYKKLVALFPTGIISLQSLRGLNVDNLRSIFLYQLCISLLRRIFICVSSLSTIGAVEHPRILCRYVHRYFITAIKSSVYI